MSDIVLEEFLSVVKAQPDTLRGYEQKLFDLTVNIDLLESLIMQNKIDQQSMKNLDISDDIKQRRLAMLKNEKKTYTTILGIMDYDQMNVERQIQIMTINSNDYDSIMGDMNKPPTPSPETTPIEKNIVKHSVTNASAGSQPHKKCIRNIMDLKTDIHRMENLAIRLNNLVSRYNYNVDQKESIQLNINVKRVNKKYQREVSDLERRLEDVEAELNRDGPVINRLTQEYNDLKRHIEQENLKNLDPVAKYSIGFGEKKKNVGPKYKTAWQQLVSDVKRENPHLSFKEVLQVAKRIYG